jgi:hypothetical protein
MRRGSPRSTTLRQECPQALTISQCPFHPVDEVVWRYRTGPIERFAEAGSSEYRFRGEILVEGGYHGAHFHHLTDDRVVGTVD